MRAALATAAVAIAFLALATPAVADTTEVPPTQPSTQSSTVQSSTAETSTTQSSTVQSSTASTDAAEPTETDEPTDTDATEGDEPAETDQSSTSTSSTSTSTTSTSTTSTSTTPVSSSPSSSPTSTPSTTAHVPVPAPDSRRVIVYYQKHYENEVNGTGYISPLPLLTENTGVDVVILAAIHMNTDPKDPTKAVFNLNDNPPSHPMYDRMWAELHQMQDAGVPVIAMIGGAMNDTWPNLKNDFETQYAELKKFVQTYQLDGIDLDIELDEAQMNKGLRIDIDTVVKVIDRLRADFGPDFLITSSPVMDEFGPGDPEDPNSDPAPDGAYGVNFNELYRQRGDQIAWFNMQAYCGHGLPTAEAYRAIVDYQQRKGADIPTGQLVIAAITNPENCTNANGWIPIDELTGDLTDLAAEYATFGGVAGWEYFNSYPGQTPRPWEWAGRMRAALDADPTPTTTPTTTTPTTTTPPTTTESPTVDPVTSTSSTSDPFPVDPFTVDPFVPVDVTPTWAVPPAPAPVAAYPTTVGDQRALASTGVDVTALTSIGGLSILLGAVALVARRRTSRSG